MSMFDSGNGSDDQDQQIADRVIAALIESLEGQMGSDLKGRPGMGVEVQAADPESLKAGLAQASDAVDKGPGALAIDGKGAMPSPEAGDDDDLERLKELFGSDDDDKDSKFSR